MDINWIVDSPFNMLPVGDPSTIAVSIDGEHAMTYQELRDRRNRFVDVLCKAGVQRGDRVAIVMLNSLDYIALYFAVGRIGAVAVRVNFRLAPQELAFLISDSGSSFVVFHSSRSEQLEPIQAQSIVDTWLCIQDDGGDIPNWARSPDLASASSEESRLPRPSDNDSLMIMYTSGTTGRPKGSLWTHQNSLWAAAMQAIGWRYSPETVAFSIAPLHHVMGLEAMLLAAMLVHGGMVLLSNGSVTLDRALAAVRRSGATIAWLPPFMLSELARRDDIDGTTFPKLKILMSGGDTVHAWALQAIQKKFPDVEIQGGYGLTEGGSMVTTLDAAKLLTHPESVGRPFPLTQVKVMKDETSEAKPEEIGEVWVQSPAISGLYWNRPHESSITFADGWCRTGDIGFVTPDGYLVLSGRSKDMIRSGGENIYPAEIEVVLSNHAQVAAVAIVAVPDEKYLEVGCAVVVPTESTANITELERELRDFVLSQFARYKCPKYFVFVEQLPLNSSGKLQKTVLRETYGSLGNGSNPLAY